ncbi:hypothetical protein [Spirochaeta isovalerica]|uniref:PilZ domain-containing protein n=1 Tax=Spirochaeta isovalerica TaxID=150 RepID=A0A841R6Y8_9SPIO|nr:hypothetical protein [Spirochaeta isovalerica]MBB6479141.1 hypothetical protein [Spirochaeta isovalerica]
MTRTIDARIFFLLPGESDRIRINQLVEREICESFILEEPGLVKKILLQQDKSILLIDYSTFPDCYKIEPYCREIIDICGEHLIRIFIVDSESRVPPFDRKISFLTRKESEDKDRMKSIVDDLNIWGLRSYIRFGSHNSRIAVFRMKIHQNWRTGVIHDISASGMSCSFDRHDDIDVSGKSTTIEIIIREQIFSLEGNFLIRRTFKNTNMFVLVFSSRRGGGNLNKLNSIIFKLTRQQVLEKIEKLASE